MATNGPMNIPPPPQGFVLDTQQGGGPPVPPPQGFQLDTPQQETDFGIGEAQPWGPHLWDKYKAGLAGAIGLPEAGMAAIPGPQMFIAKLAEMARGKTAQEAARELLNVKDIPIPKTAAGKESKGAEYAGTIAEFAGAGTLPGGGVIAGARNKLVAAITEAIATGVAGTSAGQASHWAEDFAKWAGIDPEKAKKVGFFLGSLLGPGVAGAASRGMERAGVGAAKAGKKIGLGGFGEEAQKADARRMAHEDLQSGMARHPGTEEAVQATKDIEAATGAKFPLGEATEAPGVLAIQQRIAGSSAEDLSRAAQVRNQNMEALGEFAGEKFPPTEVSPTAGAATLYRARTRDVAKQLDEVNKGLSDLADLPQADPALVGGKIRELRSQAQNVARKEKNRLYDEAYDIADKQGTRVDVTDVQDLMAEIAGDPRNIAQKMPRTYAELRKAMNRVEEGNKSRIILPSGEQPSGIPVSFKELHSMMKLASRDARAATDGTTRYQIEQVGELLKAKVGQLEGQGTALSDKLAEANKFYREQYLPTYQEGLGGRLTNQTKFGEATADEDVVRKLVFPKHGQQGLDDFLELFPNSAEANQALELGVLDVFARDVVRNGEIQPRLVESFKRNHRQQLEKLPEVRAKLDDLDMLNNQLLARRANVQQQQATLDRTALGKIVREDNPEVAVNAALRDRKQMQALLATAGKVPGGKPALARSIARAVGERKDPYGFIQENSQMLRRVLGQLGPDHFDNLLILARGASKMEKAPLPTTVGVPHGGDVIQQMTGISTPGWVSRLRQMAMRFQSPEYIAADFGTRWLYRLRGREADRLLREAIYDPDLAAALRKTQEPTATAADVNNLKNHAFAHGVRVIAVLKAEEERNRAATP